MSVPAPEKPVNLAAFQRLRRGVLPVSSSAFVRTPRAASAALPVALSDVSMPRSAKWRLLAAQEHAMPGFMTLQAIRDGGHVVDFVWDFASASAARLLGHKALDLVGKRLLDVFAGDLAHPAVFDQYRRVAESSAGEAIQQVHVVDGVEDTYRHCAVRLADGVAVTLTNLSAVRRAHALRLEVSALQATNANCIR